MRHALFATTALVALTLSFPAQAQDQENRIAALERQIEAAQATINALRTELTALRSEGGPALSVQGQIAAPTLPPTGQQGRSGLETIPGGSAAFPTEWGGLSWVPALQPVNGSTPPREVRFASVNLVSGPEAGRAAFALSRIIDRTGPRTPATVWAIHEETTLELSAPLAKNSGDDAPFATLDGLTSGTKLELEFTQTRSRIPTEEGVEALEVIAAARQRCRDQRGAENQICQQFENGFMETWFKQGDEDEFAEQLARLSLQHSWAWSLRAALGFDEYSYYPAPLLAKTTDEEVSWSLGGGLTYFPFERGVVSVDLDYERSYEAGTAQTTCPVPAAGATTVACVPGPLQPPELGDRLIFAPELRYLHPIQGNHLVRALAFAPRIEFDLLSSDVAFDLPIYFAADAKSGLTGGVRFGYTTEDDDFKFGVFVGKAFSLFR